MDILNASATQTSNTKGKSDWVVNSNKGEKLYELPKTFNEKQAMAAIHMARHFSDLGVSKVTKLLKAQYEEENGRMVTASTNKLRLLNEHIDNLSKELLTYMDKE